MKSPKLHKLIRDMSSEEYHSTPNSYSSTQFKDLLDDEDVFIKKYIEKTVEREQIAAFDVGTYFHTGVLEPHKLKDDCIVFPGKVRRGKEWDRFKKKHGSKAIVTQSQKDQAEGLVKAVANSPIAQGYLDGDPEVSLFVSIIISAGRIYAPAFNKVLTKDGWEDTGANKALVGFGMTVKVRADTLGARYISDLKSTTGNARSNRSMRAKIKNYDYDLSAALYLDLFSLVRPDLNEFVWIFASKDLFNSKSYRASQDNIHVGRAKYMKAMIKLADCAQNNWQSVDYLDVLEPYPEDLEWLRERDADLL